MKGCFCMELLGILSGYFSAACIHELTHLAAFKMRKIRIRVFYIWPLVFFKKDKKWHIKLRQINILTFGGMVIPDINIIQNEQQLKKTRKDFERVMIAAPIANIVFHILASLCYFYNPLKLYEEWKQAGLFYFLGVSIATVLITLTSWMKGNGMYGDYAAYFMLKKDRYFAVYAIYQYICFSSEYPQKNASFIREKVSEGLKEAYDKEYFGNMLFDCVNTLVMEYLTGRINIMPKSAVLYITLIETRYKQLLIHYNNEALRTLLYNLVPYYYRVLKDEISALKLHHYLSKIISSKNRIYDYYHKRNQHILGIKDYQEYLKQPKNIISGMLYQLINLFEEYYEDEWKITGLSLY